MNSRYFNNIVYISKKNFFSKKIIPYIRSNISKGNIVILKNAFRRKKLINLFKKIKKNSNKISRSTKMVEGIKNIYYKSKSRGAGKYTTNDYSWYFFPWNNDQFGLLKLIQKYFNQVILANKYEINSIVNNTPKDILIQRFHMMYYPYNVGHISPHTDPTNITKVTCGIYITSFRHDYDTGGFYVFNKKKEKIFIDHKINSGDLILFYNGLIHGVEPTSVIRGSKKNKDAINGRVFLNLSILESHHNKNRKTTIGYNI